MTRPGTIRSSIDVGRCSANDWALQPVVKLRLHSAGDASPLTALLLPQIFPILHPTVHKTHGGGPRSAVVAPLRRSPHGADCAPWGGSAGRLAALGATLDFHHGLLTILARRPRPEPILRGFTHHRPLDVRNDAGQLLLECRGADLAVSAHDRGPLVQFGEVVNQRGDDECVAVSAKLP